MRTSFNTSIWKPFLFVAVALASLAWMSGCAEESAVQPGGNLLRLTGSRTTAGTGFDVSTDRDDLRQTSLAVTATVAPSAGGDDLSSDMPVAATTQGKIFVTYATPSGRGRLMKLIEVNNASRIVTYNGTPVETLGQVIGEREIPDNASNVSLYIFFDLPVTVTLDGVADASSIVTGLRYDQLVVGVIDDVPKTIAQIYSTDSGRTISTTKDAYPNKPDMDSLAEDSLLRRIGLKDSVTKVGPTSDSNNCHGWTFTCGKTWIVSGSDVQKILDDNGYAPVTNPQPGDIVVYKNAAGQITHTGIVRAKPGGGTEIESKWGRAGRYKHSPTAVPPSYGTPTYYHTDRPAPPGSTDPGKDKHTLKHT